MFSTPTPSTNSNSKKNEPTSSFLLSPTSTLIKSTINDLRLQLNYCNYNFNDKSTFKYNSSLLNMGKSSLSLSSSSSSSTSSSTSSLVSNKIIHKSTPSLSSSHSPTSYNCHTDNNNNNQTNKTTTINRKNVEIFSHDNFLPIKQTNLKDTIDTASLSLYNHQKLEKQNESISIHTRELFTPDSLESSISSCLNSDDSDEDKDSYSNQHKSKTDSALTQSSSSSCKQSGLDLEADFETDEEICQINTEPVIKLNESTLILEKIDKINKLQEKINDINNKIKSIDMNSPVVNTNTNKNYYCLHQDILEGINGINDEEDKNNDDDSDDSEVNSTNGMYYVNPEYCEDDEDEYSGDEILREKFSKEFKKPLKNRAYDEDEEKINESYRDRNNQTRLGVRREVDEGSDSDEDYEYPQNDDSNDEDDFVVNTDQIVYKQAQPVHKKFASTGFLFHRFGCYLAPIEEGPEDLATQDDASESTSNSNLNEFVDQKQSNMNKRASTSCFNLDCKNLNGGKKVSLKSMICY